MLNLLRTGTTIAVLLLLLGGATAGETAKPMNKASKGNFVAVASIVTDPDWEKKWNVPADSTPAFHVPGVMRRGDKAWLLTFFAGPKLRDGKARIKCDIAIIHPDHSTQREPARLCFEGPVPSVRGALFITGMVIGIEIDATDTTGLTVFDVGVTDANSGVRVRVTVSLEVDAEKPKA